MNPLDTFKIFNPWKRRWGCTDAPEIVVSPKGSSEGGMHGNNSWEKNWNGNKNHNNILIDGVWKSNENKKNDPGTAAYGWVMYEDNS